MYFFVIPAKAGIQYFQSIATTLDSGFYWSDDFLRSRQHIDILIRQRRTRVNKPEAY